ncbi:DUF167 domain-containing protein [Candidatus Woesearchaeota archaeon]|nr:DUF167 domain-containing protein [Candidatus Woesearchaeota archaeon]
MDSSSEFAEAANLEKIAVVVKPNSSKNEIISYNSEKKAWMVNIKAAAEKDKANKELLKFMKKETGRAWMIKTGLHSREKVLAGITSSQRNLPGL